MAQKMERAQKVKQKVQRAAQAKGRRQELAERGWPGAGTSKEVRRMTARRARWRRRPGRGLTMNTTSRRENCEEALEMIPMPVMEVLSDLLENRWQTLRSISTSGNRLSKEEKIYSQCSPNLRKVSKITWWTRKPTILKATLAKTPESNLSPKLLLLHP